MLLQTDPTVIYGLGDKFDGNLRKKDLLTDQEYNTYTRRGLPPTPIALPGLASIQAVFNPAKTDAFYFVAKGNGESHFSNNLADHNRAVSKYQKTIQLRHKGEAVSYSFKDIAIAVNESKAKSHVYASVF